MKIRETLELLREMGVRRAALDGDTLLEVEFEPATVELPPLPQGHMSPIDSAYEVAVKRVRGVPTDGS